MQAGQKGWEAGKREEKFRLIFLEECSLLPSIFKIIEEKVKHLLTLKNISNITPFQFYQWISTFKYWQRYFDYLVEEHPLINFSPNPNPRTAAVVEQLCEVVRDNLRRAMGTMGLERLLEELTVGYVNVHHKVTH